MTEISNAELALLSLLAEKSRHAYEIEQVIEERNIRHWTEIGFSSIYRILSKLEDSGWLSGQLVPPEGRGPARKVYTLTPAGREVWEQASLQTLAAPERKFSSFLLGLDNLGALPKDKALQAVQSNLANQRTVYNHLRSAVENHPLRDDFYISIFFDYMLTQMAAEIKWLGELCDRLDTRNPKME